MTAFKKHLKPKKYTAAITTYHCGDYYNVVSKLSE